MHQVTNILMTYAHAMTGRHVIAPYGVRIITITFISLEAVRLDPSGLQFKIHRVHPQYIFITRSYLLMSLFLPFSFLCRF